MNANFKEAADNVLRETVTKENGLPGAPGVVAMATDHRGNLQEGAAGPHAPDKDQPMTTDTAFTLYSCTKEITGVAVMRLAEPQH